MPGSLFSAKPVTSCHQYNFWILCENHAPLPYPSASTPHLIFVSASAWYSWFSPTFRLNICSILFEIQPSSLVNLSLKPLHCSMNYIFLHTIHSFLCINHHFFLSINLCFWMSCCHCFLSLPMGFLQVRPNVMLVRGNENLGHIKCDNDDQITEAYIMCIRWYKANISQRESL